MWGRCRCYGIIPPHPCRDIPVVHLALSWQRSESHPAGFSGQERVVTGVPFGVRSNSHWAVLVVGMRTQPWLRGNPKDCPARSCQGAVWMQMVSLRVMHIAQGTPGATKPCPRMVTKRYLVKKTVPSPVGVGDAGAPVLT